MKRKNNMNLSFDPQVTKNYLNNPNFCPFCGKDCITFIEFDACGGPSALIECMDCGRSWYEIFKLVGIEKRLTDAQN